jgi:hypothetical protein
MNLRRSRPPEISYPVDWTLENPHAERVMRALLLEAQAEDHLVVCGMTLHQGIGNP